MRDGPVVCREKKTLPKTHCGGLYWSKAHAIAVKETKDEQHRGEREREKPVKVGSMKGERAAHGASGKSEKPFKVSSYLSVVSDPNRES